MPPFTASCLITHRFVLAIALGFSLNFMAGCSGPKLISETEEGPIYELVNGLLDAWINDDESKAIFAEGSLPSKEVRARYGQLAFSIVSDSIDFTGDTEATFQVQYQDPNSGELIGSPMTWTAVKEGEDWKLKDAPLPPGR